MNRKFIIVFYLLSSLIYSRTLDFNLNDLLTDLKVTKIVINERVLQKKGEEYIQKYKVAVITDTNKINEFRFVSSNRRGSSCMCGNKMWIEFYSNGKLILIAGLPYNHEPEYKNIKISGVLENEKIKMLYYPKYKDRKIIKKLNKNGKALFKEYQNMFKSLEVDTIHIN